MIVRHLESILNQKDLIRNLYPILKHYWITALILDFESIHIAHHCPENGLYLANLTLSLSNE